MLHFARVLVVLAWLGFALCDSFAPSVSICSLTPGRYSAFAATVVFLTVGIASACKLFQKYCKRCPCLPTRIVPAEPVASELLDLRVGQFHPEPPADPPGFVAADGRAIASNRGRPGQMAKRKQ